MNHSCSRLLAIGTALLVSAAPGPAVAAVDLGPTRIVSVSDQGVAGDGASWDTRVSGDGRFIAFTSEASTLVPGDTNGTRDTFVKDLSDGSLERVSVDGRGRQLTGHGDVGSISTDGRHVLFSTVEVVETATGSRLDQRTFVRDRAAGTTRPIRSSGTKT